MNSRYAQNAGAVYSLKYHIVWCPMYRRPVLVDAVAERLRDLLAEKAAELRMTIHALEVTPTTFTCSSRALQRDAWPRS
jgi:putative transposase